MENNTRTVNIDDLSFLKDKFKQSKVKVGCFIVALSLTVLFLVFGIYDIYIGKRNAVAFNPIEDQTNETVYVDIKGITGWIVKDEETSSYYSEAVDDKYYYYVVYLNEGNYSNLDAQYEYIEKEAAEPKSKRMYGKAFLIDHNIVNTFVDEGAVKNSDDFFYYYGYYAIDLTASTPISEARVMIAFSIISFMVSIILGIFVFIKKRNFDRSLKDLDSEDIYLAASELLETEKYKGIVLTKHFIFDFNNKTIVKYDNVLWTYPGVKTTVIPMGVIMSISSSKVLNIKTKSINNYQCSIELKDFIDSKTEGCLRGYTKENKLSYKDAKKNGIKLVKEIEEEKPIIENQSVENTQPIIENQNIENTQPQQNNFEEVKEEPKVEVVKEKPKKKSVIKRIIEVFFIVLGVLFALLIILIIVVANDDDTSNFNVGESLTTVYEQELASLEGDSIAICNVAKRTLDNQTYSENFCSSAYYLEIEMGGCETVTIHTHFETDKEYFAFSDINDMGAGIDTAWGEWDENGVNIDLTISATKKGYGIVTVTNDFNDDEIKIFVYCK